MFCHSNDGNDYLSESTTIMTTQSTFTVSTTTCTTNTATVNTTMTNAMKTRRRRRRMNALLSQDQWIALVLSLLVVVVPAASWSFVGPSTSAYPPRKPLTISTNDLRSSSSSSLSASTTTTTSASSSTSLEEAAMERKTSYDGGAASPVSSILQQQQQDVPRTTSLVLADDADFVKPDPDPRQYRVIVLPNNLQVLLVSDQLLPGAVGVEAASVHVQAGHFDDTLPGLAHFHEQYVMRQRKNCFPLVACHSMFQCLTC
jgi:hypothetical protein